MATVDAEEARQACSVALRKLMTGQTEAAQVILSEFAQKCGRLVAAEEMAAEQDQSAMGTGGLDLEELRNMVDLHNDQPEREDY